MNQYSIGNRPGMVGETKADMENADTDMLRGTDHLHNGGCSPGGNSKPKVVYVISRQIQYIVIGSHQQ